MASMSKLEHRKWEQWWMEADQRDFERDVYSRCDEEDREDLQLGERP